jgi:hypothetical protein
MRFKFWQVGCLLSVAAFAFVLSGCGQADNKSGQAKDKDAGGKPSQVAQAKQEDKKGETKAGHDWWCDEHGVPEAECSMCNARVAAECKKKGDWCEKHDRAKSQCFICNPKLADRYAAVYRAKYGKEPPEATDNEPPKQEEKK